MFLFWQGTQAFKTSSKVFSLTLALLGGDRLSSVESQQENELRAREAALSNKPSYT